MTPAKRGELVRLLANCDDDVCDWPARTLRNGSGHDSRCPVHRKWVATREPSTRGVVAAVDEQR